jgi:lambda family phage portal protein
VLQAKVKRPRGAPDVQMNARIESFWRDWGKRGSCDVTGTLSLSQILRLVVRTLARDGEALIRMQQGDRGLLRIQILDIDRLDEEKNDDLGARGAIKMGVELDSLGRPIAYHLLRRHPGETGIWGGNNPREYERIPATEILHVFVPEYPEQVRGLPWMTAAMMRLWNLSGFEEAAVINARVGASKMGFYVSPDGELPATLADGKDSTNGRFVQDAEPGAFDVLPMGYDFKTWDPAFPDQAVEPFIRTSLRGIAAGLGVAYHSLANDPSNVNYSTARVALLEERDTWMAIQEWLVEALMQPLYERWLNQAQLAGMLPANDTRLTDVRWACKRWQWVDPLKETQAQTEALKARLTSRTRILMESGEDFEDILAEIAQEEQLAESMGVELEPESNEPESNEPEPESMNTEESENDRRLRVA